MKLLALVTILPLILAQLTLVSDDVLKIATNAPFQYSLSATGGQPPYVFSATGLPNGISISGSSITGTTDKPGVLPVVITLQDSNGASSSKHIFVYVSSSAASPSSQTTQTTITTTSSSSSSNVGNSGISSTGDFIRTAPSSGIPQPTPTLLTTTNSGGLTASSSQMSMSGNQNSMNSQTTYLNSPQPSSQFYQQGPTVSIPSNLRSVNTQSSYNSQNYNQQPSANLQPTNFQAYSPPTGIVVPTTTPYITNYSFASSLNTAPTVSTSSADAAFQRQANINKVISNLLTAMKNSNATLLSIQANIPNTTSILNDAIQNQRIAQAQVNAIMGQNTTISNNISAIQSGIKTLQSQVVSTTNTLNNSQVQAQNYQNKIIQDNMQINDAQNKLSQANSSLQDAISRQALLNTAINKSKTVIISCTQNITSLQNDIDTSQTHLAKLSDSLNNQKGIILSLQKQLQAAILALAPLQVQLDYFTLIPTVGPGLIQQNKTILLAESTNLAQSQPLYDGATNDVQSYTNLISQITSSFNSLQIQLSANKLAYSNLMGSQSNQEGLFNNTLANIALQTSMLNTAKQQQQQLLNGPYVAALQVVSDSTNKVNLLKETLNALNKRYQSVQADLASSQKSLEDALQQKELADQAVNQAIQSGSSGSVTGATSVDSVLANIVVTGRSNP